MSNGKENIFDRLDGSEIIEARPKIGSDMSGYSSQSSDSDLDSLSGILDIRKSSQPDISAAVADFGIRVDAVDDPISFAPMPEPDRYDHKEPVLVL